MNWQNKKHIPVEDDKGNLVGILTYRDLLKIFSTDAPKSHNEVIVRDIMTTELITVSLKTPTLDALKLMREKDIGCLPVVKNKKLVGMITAQDFLTVSTRLFEERLQNL
jgi:CBS domain-containing protein